MLDGNPQTQTARELGVSRSVVAKWMRAYRSGGEQALSTQARGRPAGVGLLSDVEKREVFSTVCRHTPKDMGVDAELWTNQAIRHVLVRDFHLSATAMTVSLWMRQWGFTGPQPRAGANTQYDEETSKVALWYLRELPQLKRLARKRRGRVLLFDERSLPERPDSAGSAVAILCAVDGPGTLYFLPVASAVTVGTRIDFLRRLRQDIGRPLFVLLDAHCANPRPSTRAWQREKPDDITLTRIPVRDLQQIPSEYWPFKKSFC